MKINDAVMATLVECKKPIVVEYDLFRILRDCHFKREYNGKRLKVGKVPPDRDKYRRVVSQLLADRYLRPDPDFEFSEHRGDYSYSRVFRISDLPDGTAEDITGLVDPFCYISHLSAMQRYGLTNRIPESLVLTTPKNWKILKNQKVEEDYGSSADHNDYTAPLTQLTFPKIIRKRPVVLHKTVRSPFLKSVRDTYARIAAVGETFVQMLDRPELCGGMAHIVDVWDEHATTYLEEIIKAVDNQTESIIKVRAGYLLEERLGIQDSRILAWIEYAQRGGSRKLDPSGLYVSSYSPKWMISLNVGIAHTS